MKINKISLSCYGMGIRKPYLTIISDNDIVSDNISIDADILVILKSYKDCVLIKKYKYDIWAVSIFKSMLVVRVNIHDFDSLLPNILVEKQMLWSILKEQSFIIKFISDNNISNPVKSLLNYYYKGIRYPKKTRIQDSIGFWAGLMDICNEHNIFISVLSGDQLRCGLMGLACPIIKVRNISSFSVMALLLAQGVLELHWAIDIERGASFVDRTGKPINARILVSSSSQARLRSTQQSLIKDVHNLMSRHNI